MTEASERQGDGPEQPQAQETRQPTITTIDRLRLKQAATRRKVEPFDFELDGELVRVDAHELSGGDRIKVLDIARMLNEGKMTGGNLKFYREVIARVYREHGTGRVIWNLEEKGDVALIEALPREALDALFNNALKLNGMDPGSLAEAKNGSRPAD